MDPSPDFVWQMWPAFAVIAAAIGLYSVDRIPIEMVSIGVILALMGFFHAFPVVSANGENVLGPGDLLAGFANPALFSVMALLVIGQGMFQSGALEKPTQSLLALSEKRPAATTAATFAFMFFTSAFMNNTPVVVIFIPIVAALAAQRGAPASKLMMPLSFVCILAGMTTLIGSSTNLLAADSYRQATGERIDFFEFTVPGAFLASIGLLYMAVIGRNLMPDRFPASETGEESGDGKQFIAQIEISPGHPLIGTSSVAGFFPDLAGITVRLVQRRNQSILPPFEDFELRAGDILIVAATRQALTQLLTSKPGFLSGMIKSADGQDPAQATRDLALSEAIVAPGSRMTGRTIDQIGFQYQTNCVLLGVQRRSRMIRARMGGIRLEAGDVLLILGGRKDVRALRANRDVIVLEWSMTDLPDFKQAVAARAIFLGVVITAASGVAPIVFAAMTGAAAMVATGVLNIRQASRAVDQRIFLLIGAALAMGAALEHTEGATFLAMQLVHGLKDFGVAAVLSAFFLLAALVTNLLSNNATAVLFTPVAVSAAQLLGVNPLAFVITVIFAANCSFATPVSYQTNLLVMGPGHYKFRDFLRVGGPLIVVLWLAFSVAAPLYFRAVGYI
ncbi:MAG: SLC13 family permease [Pseudomonadota bacterium]